MKAFVKALGEVWGLFVEDASFTLAMIVCLAAAAYIVPRAPLPTTWRGPVLFVMLAVALIENVARSARVSRDGRKL